MPGTGPEQLSVCLSVALAFTRRDHARAQGAEVAEVLLPTPFPCRRTVAFPVRDAWLFSCSCGSPAPAPGRKAPKLAEAE